MAVGLASGFTTVLLLSVGMSWFSLVTSLVLSDRREVKYHALASQKRAVTLPWYATPHFHLTTVSTSRPHTACPCMQAVRGGTCDSVV